MCQCSSCCRVEVVDDNHFLFQFLVGDADMCKQKMQAASTLVNDEEKTRWTEQSKEFESQLNRPVTVKISKY